MLVSTAAAQTWTPTGSMLTERYNDTIQNNTATILPNGKVLVTGGADQQGIRLASAELNDPATGTWQSTGPMNALRSSHTATLLPTGKVLITGGITGRAADGTLVILRSAELYDPVSGIFTLTGPMNAPRRYHTATLLPNSKILVAGGGGGGGLPTVASAELYDPDTGTWSLTASLGTARKNHTAALLPDGTVLVAGGHADGPTHASAERYDPATETWTAVDAMNTPRFHHYGALLSDGQVLVAGGVSSRSDDPGVRVEASAEIFRPVVLPVTIDIKPGDFPNSIKLNSKGKIAVAILSTNGFNAPAQVDQASLTFGRIGDEPSLAFCKSSGEDVNGDGILDLVCHFHSQAAGFQAGDTQGILKGKTTCGRPIIGTDSVRVVK